MTNFVLNKDKLILKKQIDAISFTMSVTDYALFLKKHLKLEMFVPCDERGNILEEPKVPHTFGSENTDKYINQFKSEIEIYKKAKEKVIFVGFDIIQNDEIKLSIKCSYFQFDFNKTLKRFENYKTIEDLTTLDLECVLNF